MKQDKRQRLESRGWRIADTQEFLQLSDDEARYIELKLALAQHLRKVREARSMTQVELAKATGSSQSRVAKMEAGDPSVSLDLLVKTLLALGATSKEIAGAMASTRAA